MIEENLIYGMLTLPSNMFYTVTLPATLWFFDRAKTDDRILFIDARNIFTPIDRRHREFSAEQIQNIAIISRLHKGRRDEFVALVERYFAEGMNRLTESRKQVEPVSRQLLEVLDDRTAKVSNIFLYAYMRYSGFSNYIKEFANGANVLHLKPDLIGKQRFLFPPEQLQARFSNLVEPIYLESDYLEEAITLLERTRDLLLPRLISGRLRVEDLDIQLPPSMQSSP